MRLRRRGRRGVLSCLVRVGPSEWHKVHCNALNLEKMMNDAHHTWPLAGKCECEGGNTSGLALFDIYVL